MPIRLSGFFDPRSARAVQGVPPRLQFHGANGAWTYVIGMRSSDTGKYVAQHTPVSLGSLVVLDFGAIEKGPLSFRPFDDQYLVPLHHPVPPTPEDGDYTAVVRLPVMLEKFGLAQWTVGGVIAQNVLFTVHGAYQHAAEAVVGKLPVYRMRPSRQIQIASRNGELHNAPVFEGPVGWVDRDEERYGPRTVPPPLPLLGPGKPAPGLPPAANSNGPAGSAEVPPWDNPASSASNTPPAQIPSPAANDDDPFQGMIPVKEQPRPKF